MYCVLVQTRNIGFEISSEAVLSGDIVYICTNVLNIFYYNSTKRLQCFLFIVS